MIKTYTDDGSDIIVVTQEGKHVIGQSRLATMQALLDESPTLSQGEVMFAYGSVYVNGRLSLRERKKVRLDDSSE